VIKTANVYCVQYDLANANPPDEPVEERMVLAVGFDEAYQVAQSIRNDVRSVSAVYRECVVRSIELMHRDVVVSTWEEVA
jgi:hypothetical protein